MPWVMVRQMEGMFVSFDYVSGINAANNGESLNNHRDKKGFSIFEGIYV